MLVVTILLQRESEKFQGLALTKEIIKLIQGMGQDLFLDLQIETKILSIKLNQGLILDQEPINFQILLVRMVILLQWALEDLILHLK